MKNDVAFGKNRTGIALSPIDERELLEVTEMTVPSMDGDETVIADARAEYIEEGAAPSPSRPPSKELNRRVSPR